MSAGSFEVMLSSAVRSCNELLQHLSKDDLSRLLTDDQKLDNIINDLQEVKSATAERESLLAANRSLAESNLSLEPKLNSGKEKLRQTYENAVALKEAFDQKKSELDRLSASRSLDTTLALLQTATAEEEEASEKIAESLLDGSADAATFVQEFLPPRKLMYTRKVKSEKLAELLRAQHAKPQQTYRTSYSGGAAPQTSGMGYPSLGYS